VEGGEGVGRVEGGGGGWGGESYMGIGIGHGFNHCDIPAFIHGPVNTLIINYN
jgi:hypothetical protein